MSTEGKQVNLTEKNAEHHEDLRLQRTSSDEDNYGGITLTCALVYLALLTIGFAQMMVLVSTGSVSRSMVADIGGEPNVIWFTQTVTIMNLVWGSPMAHAADYWGRKLFLLFCCLSGVVGSIIISRSQSFAVALFGNILAGIAASGQPLLWTIASEIVPRKYRPQAQSGIVNIFALGAVMGLCGGAALAQGIYQGWRIVWYVNTGLFVFATVVTYFLYNPPKRSIQINLSFREKMACIDWVGIALLDIGVILFVAGLTFYNNPYPFGSAYVLGPFITGCATAIALVVHQAYFKKDGIFHHNLFQSRNVLMAFFAVFLEGVAFFAANTYVPFQAAVLGFNTDSVLLALRFAIVFAIVVVVSPITAAYMSWAKQVRIPTIFAFSCFCIFYGLMISVDRHDGIKVWGYLVFLGLGLGAILPLVLAILHLAVSAEMLALASGASFCFRALGACIGLPIYTAIFTSQNAKYIPSGIAAAVLPLGLPELSLAQFIPAILSHSPELLGAVPGITPEIIAAGSTALADAYAKSFRAINIAALILSVVALVASFFIKDPKDAFTSHVDAPLEHKVLRVNERDPEV